MRHDNVRILLVDDEPALLTGLTRLLRRHQPSWDLCAANGGAEAVALLASSQFDVVVTDLRMPDVDGLQVLRAASEHQRGATRVVLSSEPVDGRFAVAGHLAHERLHKPCDTTALIDVILAS